MKLVVDANIIISLLIKPGKPLELFFHENLEVFGPGLLMEEINRNKAMILEKSGLNESELKTLLILIKQKLILITEDEFTGFFDSATETCPHHKDITYFALALYLKCPIWSNEKKLKEQNKVVIYATHELMDLFGVG